MKKSLAVLAIVAVFSLGIIGALAIVPHIHGDDTDHSKNQGCAVHQAATVILGGSVSIFVLICGFAFVARIVSDGEQAFVSYSTSSLFLRAPPQTS